MMGNENWRNRIVGEGEESPENLLANPFNWRIHPLHQQNSLSEILDEVGWVQRIIVNRTTGHVVDGHLRVAMAISKEEKFVPVVYVELSEEEEKLVLATLDPIATLAATDSAQYHELLAQLCNTNEQISSMVSDIATSAGLVDYLTSPSSASPIYTDDQIIDSAFNYHRLSGFPYRRLPIFIMMQEINRLSVCDEAKLLHTMIAYQVADHYHPHRYHVAANGRKSPLEAFLDDRLMRISLELTMQHQQRLPFGLWGSLLLVRGTQSVSNFRPGFACSLYRRFCQSGNTILDTSAGYGGRLVGYFASGINGLYIGIDPNNQVQKANERMALELGFSEQVELHCLPAEDIPHSLLQSRCDFAFTSPPYFSKEIYSNDDTQSCHRYPIGEAWRVGFLNPMLALQFSALKPGGYSALNIANVNVKGHSYPLVEWADRGAQLAGFEKVDVLWYHLTKRFGAHQDAEPAREPVLIYRKPNE